MIVRALRLTLACALLGMLAPPARPTLASTVPARSADPQAETFNTRGRRFVEAANSDDAAQRKAAIHEVFVPDSLQGAGESRVLGLLDRLRERFGTLEFHHAEAVPGGSGANRRLALHVYARSAKDQGWKDLQFWLEPAPPHRIRSIVFVAEVAEPIYLPNGEITSPATLDWLGHYVDKLAAEEDLAGGLLVAQGDRVLFQRFFGYADSARHHRIGPATRFNLGSGGKMFTALVVAGLVEEGRLGFGDTLARVLPAVADQPFARRTMVAHLLSHTSGVGELWNEDYERHWNELRQLSDYLPFVLAAGTNFAPGAQFEYSNSNFILAGLVAEAVGRSSYDTLLARRIFEPLGMRNTGLFPFDDQDTLQAQRLARDGRKAWRTAPHGYRGSAAGGALSTVDDMLRFARALAGGRVVSPAMLERMTSAQNDGLPGSAMAYGYGFILSGPPGPRSFGHGGIASGVNFELRYFPEPDITLIAFSNQDNGAYDDLRRNTLRLITGER